MFNCFVLYIITLGSLEFNGHKRITQHIIQTILSNTKLRILHACIFIFWHAAWLLFVFLYFKDLVHVRINKTRVERTAVRGGGGSKALYNSQGKMRFGQGKLSKKLGNFISD